MFVSKGAKESIMKIRKEQFFDNYVSTLLSEAKSLGITTDELIRMIAEKDLNEKDKTEE